MMWHQRADVVVVGTGVAGLVAALAAHRRGRNVVVLSKAADTATFYAQGGIAVVLPDTDDSIDAHVADTIAAGAGLCDPDAVRSIVSDGYRAVVELVDDGARFDEAEPGRWSLTREGGHSRRRIIHSGRRRHRGRGATGAGPRRGHPRHPPQPRRAADSADRRRGDGRAGAQRGRARASCTPRRWSSRRAGWVICIRRPRIPRVRPVTASRWRCGRVCRSAISSSSSSTRPCCSTATRADAVR